MKFELTGLRNNTVWSMYRMRERIQLDPDYQRLSDIWTLDKRQLLIDTVINDFDIPKLYLHKFKDSVKMHGKIYDFAIIDGKQRLETMWAFIDGTIALATDFEYFKDAKIKAGNMTYSELGKEYPDLKVQFDSFQLNAMCIETDDLEIIEEMFSRLNESAPLTAPEKRNAYGGPLPFAIRELATEVFFRKKLPFSNKRYRHYDLATKFLLAEKENKVMDTKKVYLDQFVRDHAHEPRKKVPSFFQKTTASVGRMAKVFVESDPLLRQAGMVIVYYHLFRIAEKDGWTNRITRSSLTGFEAKRTANRRVAEGDITKARFDLIEFDHYVQSPNDSYAIKLRLRILLREVFKIKISVEQL